VSCVCSTASKNIIRTNFFGVTDAAKLKQRPKDIPERSLSFLGVLGGGNEARAWVAIAVAARLPVSWYSSVAETLPEAWKPWATLVDDPVDAFKNCSYLIALPLNGAGEESRVDAYIWSGVDTPSDKPALRLAGEESRLVEVVRNEACPLPSVAHAMDLARRLNKVPMLVKANRGTYVERVKGAYDKVVAELRDAGVSPVLINSAARQVGMSHAPLILAETEDIAARTTPADWAQAVDQVERLKKRLLSVQAEEAIRCLDDGVVGSALDADIGALLGWGFPMHLGGPLGYVDTLGAEVFLHQRDDMMLETPLAPASRQRLQAHVTQAITFHSD
jgi:hypothetical protein